MPRLKNTNRSFFILSLTLTLLLGMLLWGPASRVSAAIFTEQQCELRYVEGSESLEQCLAEARNNPTGDETDCQDDQDDRLLGVLPKWYKYLPYEPDVTGRCAVQIDFRTNAKGILPIGLAVLEMLLAIAGIVSVVFVMVGGFRYVTSQGEPEHTKAAQSTIINALIGGTIAIVATALVTFIGGRFT